jgi:hypothetical protein
LGLSTKFPLLEKRLFMLLNARYNLETRFVIA